MKKILFGCALVASGLAMPAASANWGNQGYNTGNDRNSFDGLYFGGNLGVFSHTAHRNDFDGLLTDNSGWTSIDTNVTAGLQLGYDWQRNYSLFGLVVDWNWADADKTLPDDPNGSNPSGGLKAEHRWFTTIRARAGLTVCNALVYVTGGAAVSKFETTWDGTSGGRAKNLNDNHTRWGWVGGVGTEFLAWCNWGLGAEVLFIQYAQHAKTFNTPNGAFAFGHSDSLWVGRILVNYRFGDLCSWWGR